MLVIRLTFAALSDIYHIGADVISHALSRRPK
jgi:hypothetical protein